MDAPIGGLRVMGDAQRRVLGVYARDGASFGSSGIDRFGRPYVRKTQQLAVPGPGMYDAPETKEGGELASSSMFRSKTVRGIEAQLQGGTSLAPPSISQHCQRRVSIQHVQAVGLNTILITSSILIAPHRIFVFENTAHNHKRRKKKTQTKTTTQTNNNNTNRKTKTKTKMKASGADYVSLEEEATQNR